MPTHKIFVLIAYMCHASLMFLCLFFFSKNGCVEGIVQRLKTYKDPELKFDIKVRHNAAFHQDLNCLPKYVFTAIQNEKGYYLTYWCKHD